LTAPASRPRPARRAIDELSLTVDRDDLEHRLTDLALGELDDRLAALEAYGALPAESNQLYTPYIDLRAARLEAAAIDWEPASRPVHAVLPDDADGLLVVSEGDVVGSALSDAARNAGVAFTTVSNVFSNSYHVYQAEIFPTEVRATAVGWTYSVSRLSSAALPFILVPVLDNYGATAMFAVVLVALAATIAVIAPIGPRTKGKSLDEINPT